MTTIACAPQVGDWHRLNDDMQNRMEGKSVALLVRNENPRNECCCGKPSDVKYQEMNPFGTVSAVHLDFSAFGMPCLKTLQI